MGCLSALVVMSNSNATTVASIPASAQQQRQKPNILFIMGDNIGWMQGQARIESKQTWHCHH